MRESFCCLMLFGAQVVYGCSVIVDVDRKQCSTSLDCQNRGAAFSGSVCVNSICQADPKWACADLPPSTEQQAAIQSKLTLTNLVTFGPMPGVRVSLCGGLDLQCAAPLGQAESDSNGEALLNIPPAFDGYTMLQSDAIEPTLYFPNLPISEGESLGVMYVSPANSLAALASQLGDVVQPGRGLAVVQIFDCQQQAAIGATLEFVGNMTGSRPYYAFNLLPSATATFVDESGIAGVLNAVPGTLGIKVKNGAKTVSQTSLLIRQGFMSFRAVQPEGMVALTAN